MNKLNENYSTIDQQANRLINSQKSNTLNSPEPGLSFKEILDSKQFEKTNSLKFSKHANQRLATRNINLSAEQMERLENGTTKAREKGIRESLVMVDDMAFIVNVKNNTVITAVGDSDGSIFTNIDGAVIS